VPQKPVVDGRKVRGGSPNERKQVGKREEKRLNGCWSAEGFPRYNIWKYTLEGAKDVSESERFSLVVKAAMRNR